MKKEIEDLPVVSNLSFIRVIVRDKAGYRANLRYLSCFLLTMEDVRMEDVVMYCEAGGGYTDGGCTVKQICLEYYWIPLTVGLADGHGGTDTRPGVWLCNKPTDLSACVSEECGRS